MTTFMLLLAFGLLPFSLASEGQIPDESPYVIEAPDVIEIEIVVLGGNRTLGRHIVQPDGTVTLKHHGTVSVSGLTVPEARQAILKAIAAGRDASSDVAVLLTVAQENSKVFYMVVPDRDGDKVYRFLCSKNETVVSAVLRVEAVAAIAATNGVRIERPTKESLNVDWQAITQHGELKSNHSVHPGDRILFGIGSTPTK